MLERGPKECPQCRRVSASIAAICGCGFRFSGATDWIFATASVISFIHAGLMLLSVIFSAQGFNPRSLSDIVTLVGLGVALRARHLWAAYALAGYSILAVIFHVSIGEAPGGSILRGILLSLLYLAAARQLLRAEHLAPPVKAACGGGAAPQIV